MNRARRKARQNNATGSLSHSSSLNRSNSTNGSIDEPERKKIKLDNMNKVEMFYNVNRKFSVTPICSINMDDKNFVPLQAFMFHSIY